jgi:hypothetical protein
MVSKSQREFTKGELELLDLLTKTIYLLLFNQKCCQWRPSFHVFLSSLVSTIIDAAYRH